MIIKLKNDPDSLGRARGIRDARKETYAPFAPYPLDASEREEWRKGYERGFSEQTQRQMSLLPGPAGIQNP